MRSLWEQSPNEMALLRASVVLLFGLLPAAAFAPMGVSRPAQASQISLRATEWYKVRVEIAVQEPEL